MRPKLLVFGAHLGKVQKKKIFSRAVSPALPIERAHWRDSSFCLAAIIMWLWWPIIPQSCLTDKDNSWAITAEIKQPSRPVNFFAKQTTHPISWEDFASWEDTRLGLDSSSLAPLQLINRPYESVFCALGSRLSDNPGWTDKIKLSFWNWNRRIT